MIWKTKHIQPQQDLYTYAKERHAQCSPSIDSPIIAIVGGGPKGLYALNHFVNQVHLNQTPKAYKVLWFNPDQLFGCGPNYDIQQPDYLLINYCIGHVNAFHPAYNDSENQKSFMSWLEEVKAVDVVVRPTDYASRALVGHYLQWFGIETLRYLPENIQVELIPDAVTAVTHRGAKARLETRSGSWEVDSLLLATGHCYENTPLISNGEVPATSYIRAPYPVSKFETVSSKAQVGIIGMGLTFIDIALALTEGRGGTFEKGYYHRSGREPIIYSFSRTSLPILCRGPQFQAQHPLQILKLSQFEKWMQQSTKIDFVREILPWIEQEIQLRYYTVLFGESDSKRVQQMISQIPLHERFTLDDLLRPSLSSEEEILQYIRMNIDEARKGDGESPFMAAAAVWGEICPYIAELYATVGFTGDSQKLIDQYYFGAFNRVSYGPPVANMEKIYALAKAGILRFLPLSNPAIRWEENEGIFSVCDENDTTAVFDNLIDGRIGRPSLQKQNAVLYDRLLRHNLIRPHENDGYFPGTLSMDKHGKCNALSEVPLYCYGSNTEGVLFDNDSLSRTKNDTACYWVEETLRKT